MKFQPDWLKIFKKRWAKSEKYVQIVTNYASHPGADKTPQDKMSQDKMSRQNATQTIRHIDKMSQDKTSHRQNVTG